MNALLDLSGTGLAQTVVLGLLGTSFVASFITVAMGIGGGALLLAVMASLMPPVALIPVHGVIQLGSNLSRAVLLVRHMQWPSLGSFALGSVVGVFLGGLVVIDLPPAAIQIGIGVFVIWSVLRKPPKWLSQTPWLIGGLSSFLTMFFGATGVFVANFTKSLNLQREAHVATHAGLMTCQHALKVLAFGLLGFGFGPWIAFIGLMIGAGVLGTLAGRLVLVRIGDKAFKRALDVILILISLRLIWNGIMG